MSFEVKSNNGSVLSLTPLYAKFAENFRQFLHDRLGAAKQLMTRVLILFKLFYIQFRDCKPQPDHLDDRGRILTGKLQQLSREHCPAG